MPASGYDEALRCCRKCIMRNEEVDQAENSVGGRMKNMFGKVGDGFKTFGSKFKNPKTLGSNFKNPFAKNNGNESGDDIESAYESAPSSAENSSASSAWGNRNPFARKSKPDTSGSSAAAAPAPAPAPPAPVASKSSNPFRNQNPFRK